MLQPYFLTFTGESPDPKHMDEDTGAYRVLFQRLSFLSRDTGQDWTHLILVVGSTDILGICRIPL